MVNEKKGMEMEEIRAGSQVLYALLISLPFISEIVGNDLQISLCDSAKVLGVWQAKSFHLPGAQSGVQLSWDNMSHKNVLEIMESGNFRVDILPKEFLEKRLEGL